MSTEAKPADSPRVAELKARLADREHKLKERIPTYPKEHRAEATARVEAEIAQYKAAIKEASK